MRFIAFLITTAVMTFGLMAVAQDDEETAADAAGETVEETADPDTFAPSEAVEADTAVVFPTDI